MIEVEPEELFVEGPDGTYRLSDNLPEPLESAVSRAKKGVQEENVGYVVEDIGSSHRPLDFGEGSPSVIQAQEASIFVSMTERGAKFLSVGVSPEGCLSDEQAHEVLSQIGFSVDLKPEELKAGDQASVALNSLNQVMNTVRFNSEALLDRVADLEVLLDSPLNNESDIEQSSTEIEATLHNYLSSIYSFRENTDSTLKQLNLSRTLKHHVQKYQDEVSVAVGLRHCMQHNMALKVTWVAEYNHSNGIFEYTVGVPKYRVNNPELYTGGEISDSGGNKHEPVEYYFGDIESRFIDLEKIVRATTKSTISVFDKLREEIQESEIEGVGIREQHERIAKFGAMDLASDDGL